MAASSEAAFSYYRSITVNHTLNPATQTNFTVLVGSGTAYSGSLATVANGGKVQSSSGFDIGFYTNSDCSTGKMNWEQEDWSATTGVARYWVLNTSLSSSVDTVFYVCYGDATISSFQGGATGTAWDSSYKIIWHLPNGSSLASPTLDSTGNSNNGTLGGTSGTPAATTGQIDGGAVFVRANQQTITSPSINIGTTFTASGWLKAVTGGNYPPILNNAYTNGFFLGLKASGPAAEFIVNGNVDAISGGVVTDISGATWHYIVGVYDATTGSLYVDGSSVASLAASNPSIGSSTIVAGHLTVGGGTNESWDGQMDELRVSATNRSANWITTEYNNQLNPFTFTTVGAETSASVAAYVPQNKGLTIQGGKLTVNGGKLQIL